MGFNVADSRVLREHFGITAKNDQMVIALAGNPNVGKSTVFNALTGLRQHTGNWPGKTVDNAQGTFTYRNKSFLLVDLPGTYSILAHTVEEEIARDFICFGKPDVTVVVLDATSLERNLNLALQVIEITSQVIICVNLIDEAKKKKISIDFAGLEKDLGVPVVATAARQGEGLNDLKEAVYQVTLGPKSGQPKQIQYCREIEDTVEMLLPKIEQLKVGQFLNSRWIALRFLDGDEKLIDNISRHLDLLSGQSEMKEVEAAL
ncbi:50S ribosome-binding GTPase [Dehalobacter sp. DCM]|uniref:FeoB small GTPase domain-containing protein n=1 Tax=Dehalobacter sp. DCM TaxID=2907827 RepID=UPI003081E241|nr:50S ribosome-binding GTPase [Dehalobacter sp. DCM]